ncbi:MAG: cytochrome c oxidase subunit 3 [Candidatus Omnitrophica bacterium]|nr:cytochrome c oxidase subunit 3 [Candidatus Omnitrophota bacterium]MCB9748101.1 cytochrome c oxidase subunit 3 [Candidatus Omnitrophota bacterium]
MDVIPYTVEERKDTGVFNAKLGIWLFLASEVMLFGALFSTYVILRIGAEHWPHGASLLNVPIGTFNTAVLITSSVTMVFSWTSLKENNFARFKNFLGITILLALLFLVVKSFEYGAKFEHHHFPKESTFLAIYFTLTGLHALHIIGGIVVLTYFWGPGSKMWETQADRFTNRIEIVGLYWHFVDLVWIFLFPILYLL